MCNLTLLCVEFAKKTSTGLTTSGGWIFFVAVIAYNIIWVPAPPAAPPAMAKNR